MGIFSFFARKKAQSGGQENFARTAGAANARIHRPQGSGNDVRATDPQIRLVSDDKEWLRYLSSAIRTHRKPGLSLDDEHQIWLKARSKG